MDIKKGVSYDTPFCILSVYEFHSEKLRKNSACIVFHKRFVLLSLYVTAYSEYLIGDISLTKLLMKLFKAVSEVEIPAAYALFIVLGILVKKLYCKEKSASLVKLLRRF